MKERESKRERERERERERGRWLHPTLCIKPFVLLLIRCSHGTVLLEKVGMDHMAAGMDVHVTAGVESRKYGPMSSGSARSAALGTGGFVQICRHCASVGSDDADIPQSSTQGNNCCPGEDAG